MQPNGCSSGTAVEEEPDGAFGFVSDPVFRIVDVEEMALGHAAGGLVNRKEADAGGVIDGLAVQCDLVLRGDGLRRILDRHHLFGVVVEAVEIVGGRRGAGAPLRESSHSVAAMRMRMFESVFMAWFLMALLVRRCDGFIEESGQLALQFGQRLIVDVGHLSGLEMADRNIVSSYFGRNVQVRKRVLGGVERGGARL